MAVALSFAALLCCTQDRGGPATPAPPAPTARAHLRHVIGQVMVKRAAGDDWIAGKEAMPLYEDDKVRTASGASAVIEFESGSNVALAEDALLGIAETHPRPGQDRTDVTLLQGHLDATLDKPAQQSLSVTTPAATVRAGREIVFQ